MPKNKLCDLDVLEMLISEAKRNGASDVDVILLRNSGNSLSCRNGKDEFIERFESFGIGLRVFVGTKSASLSTNFTAEKKLKDFTSKAVEMAKIVPEDKFSKIASKELLSKNQVNQSVDIDCYDKTEVNISDLRENAVSVEEYALNISKKLISDGSQTSSGKSESILMTSNGFIGRKIKSNHSISLSLIAKEKETMERDYDFSSKVYLNDLESPKLLAEKAALRTLKKLGSIKPKTGKFPVIFDSRVARSIVSHISSSLNGSSISRGTSFLKDSMNKKVFSKCINLVDDPTLVRGLGSRLFDSEGIGTKKIKLIEKGILKNWLLDISSSEQLGKETNGNAVRGIGGPPTPGTSNLILLPGQVHPNELINGIDEGFLVNELIGSSVSLITGDYSRGASGFWIENGTISYPVAEATIAGNLKEMFLNLSAANDLDTSHSMMAPSLRVEKMMVAGN